MGIRLTQVFIASLITVFCIVAFAAGLPDARQAVSIGRGGELAHPFTRAEWDVTRNVPDIIGNADRAEQEPLLLAAATKVFVCHFLPNGKFITEEILLTNAQRLIAAYPHEWMLGKCEDVISPS
jgi:hypothetical protein